MKVPDFRLSSRLTNSASRLGLASLLTAATAFTVLPGAAMATDNCVGGYYTATVGPGGVTATTDTAAVTLGQKFTVDAAATATSVRFYNNSGQNSVPYIVKLWDNSGNLLAGGSTGEGGNAKGWSNVSLSPHVSLSANTTYVVGYYSAVGQYQYQASAEASADNSKFVNFPADGGVYTYGSGGATFPTSTFSSNSYFVTPVVSYTGTDTTVPTTPGANFTGASGNRIDLTWGGSTDASGVESYKVFQDQTYLATVQGLHYIARPATTGEHDYYVKAVDACGNESAANTEVTETITTTEQTVFNGNTPTNTLVDYAGDAVNLGMKVKFQTSGVVKGVRFYRDVFDGTYGYSVGLWSSDGTLLGSAITGESIPAAPGWAEMRFSTPVSVVDGQEYTVGYLTRTGNYTYTSAGFDLSSPVNAGDIEWTGGAGVYAYASTLTKPTSVFNNTNYYVEPIFEHDNN
jgi:hypothetical protein